MPIRPLPHCAAYAPCAVIVEAPDDARRRSRSRRPCMRRARFVVEYPDLPPLLTCPRHVQMAALNRAWAAPWPSGGPVTER